MEDKNYSTSILEAYIEVEKYNQQITEKLFNFTTKCSELEEISEHKYEMQKTIELNKIYFQGYVLDSDICNYIKDNTSNNYSINDLKNYMNMWEQNSNEDLSSYHMALELYELADSLEDLIDTKVEYEMKKLYELTSVIGEIENANSNEYETIYNRIKGEITSNYLNLNLMDDNAFGICIQMLNDIFNYFVSGYIDIPDEYLHSN